MVKVRAPMLSMEASGSIGGALVFSSWKGTAYVRSLVKPVNPKSAAQLGVRAMMKFLAQQWATIAAQDQATWDTTAENANISPFNAYVRYNMQRWRQFTGPTQANPAAQAATPGIVTTSLTGGQRNIVIQITPFGAETPWGYAIFRNTAAVNAINWNLCVAVVAADGNNPISYTDAPLTAGTYHYSAAALSNEGSIGEQAVSSSAAAT